MEVRYWLSLEELLTRAGTIQARKSSPCGFLMRHKMVKEREKEAPNAIVLQSVWRGKYIRPCNIACLLVPLAKMDALATI